MTRWAKTLFVQNLAALSGWQDNLPSTIKYECIRVTQAALADGGLDALSDHFEKFPESANTLDLQFCNLAADPEALIRFLRNLPSGITRLGLRANGFATVPVETVQRIMAAIPETVTRLDWEGNWDGRTPAEQMIPVMQCMGPGIRHFGLGGAVLQNRPLKEAMIVLQGLPALLEYLGLGRCPRLFENMDSRNCFTLFSALPKGLQGLDLRHCNLTEMSMGSLKQALISRRIHTLDIRKNGVARTVHDWLKPTLSKNFAASAAHDSGIARHIVCDKGGLYHPMPATYCPPGPEGESVDLPPDYPADDFGFCNIL